jgi:hypothetical protein
MKSMPHIVDARYIGNYQVYVVFDDGTSGQVNLEKYPQKGGVFEPLTDLNYFKKFFIDLNTLCWPNGADIAPERIYEQMKSDSPQRR